MIWATVSSWSCFCWLYKSFTILGCKEYNQSDFGIDHLVMSTCRVFSCVVGRECLLWPVHPLGKTLLAFALLHFVLQGQICLLFQVSPDFLFFHSSLLWWKRHLFGVLVLDSLVDLHRTIHLQHYWLGYRLVLLWYWMLCLRNREHSVVFEIAPMYCILDSFVTMRAIPFLLRDSCPQ